MIMKSAGTLRISVLLFLSIANVFAPIPGLGQETDNGSAPQATDILPDEWMMIEIPEVGLSLSMPTTPKKSERTISPTANQTTTVHLQICNVSPTTSLVFAYNQLGSRPTTIPEIKDVLDGGVKGAVARTLGNLVSVKSAAVNGKPGREFVFECIQGDQTNPVELKVASRIVLIEDTLYQLTYIARAEDFSDKVARKFLDSVRYAAPPEKNTDGGQDETGGGGG